MSNKSILILCKLSNNKQPVHVFYSLLLQLLLLALSQQVDRCEYSMAVYIHWGATSGYTLCMCDWFTIRHEDKHRVCVCSKCLLKKKTEDVNFVLSQGTYRIWTHNEKDTHTHTHTHTYTHVWGDRVHWLSSDEPTATWGRRNVYGASPREAVRILSRQPRLS